MKKVYQKFLTFFFFFAIIFSFAIPVIASNPIVCNKNEDCKSPLLECKITPPRVEGICGPLGDSSANSNVSNTCKWTSETTQTYAETGGSTVTGGCSSDEYQDKYSKCSGEPPKNTYGFGITTRYICCCKNNKINSNNKPTDINPLGNLQVKIPGLDKLAEKHPARCDTDSDGETNCTIPWIAVYIKAIYNYFLLVGGLVAVIALMVGGVIWLISAGNTSRISEAKAWITGSITGVVVLLSSYVLLYQINPNLIELNFLKIESIEAIVAEAELTSAVDYTGTMPYPPTSWSSVPHHSNIINNAVGRANPELSKAIISAADCMKKHDYKIAITSLSRTVDKQKELYDKNYNHKTNECGIKKTDKDPVCCPYPVEKKLCPHTSGSAVDMWGLNKDGKKSSSAQSQLQTCMFEAGACLLETECWHFELPALSSICTKNKNFNGSYCQNLEQ